MQVPNFNRDEVLTDFASTLSSLPGCLIEISRAQPGGSKFNRASYHDFLSPEELQKIVNLDLNVGFLSGVDPDSLGPINLGEIITRSAKDEMVNQRNIISLEIDFKDVISEFLVLPARDKKTIIEQYFEKYHPEIKKSFGDIWIACFSGNSLHMHLRLKSPLDCTDTHRYAHNYDFLVDKFESEIFRGEVKFDRQCKNTARLMRLPYSSNLKVANSPIQTDVIYFNPTADATQPINILWDLADIHRENIEESTKAFSASPEASDHKSQLNQALTFRKVLGHFDYKKFNTLRDLRNGETQCSSPWKRDSNPSCFLNEAKKQFKDHSSGKGGDIFTFIAELGELDIKNQFPSVIAIAENITGIKKVIHMNLQTSKKPYAQSQLRNDFPLYEVIDGSIVWNQSKQDLKNAIPTELCNFSALITMEEIHDDGIATQMYQTIQGELRDGTTLPEISILAKDFPSLSWTALWGVRAIICAGQNKKDHLRAAIQNLSKNPERKTVYTHSGWRQFENEHKYLHTGGAIGLNGNDSSFSVNLGKSRLSDYSLPDPPVGDDLTQSIQASLSMLNLGKDGIGASLIASIAMAPLSNSILIADFCIFFSGLTGTFKSCITALLQAHFGSKFNEKHLPGNWSSTENALERQACLAADSIFTIDDFNPRGTQNEVSQYHRKADRVIRAAGNKQSRDRMDSKSKLTSQYYPKCLMISSGEEIPKGHSLRGRIWNVEIKEGDIDQKLLTKLQRDALQGTLASSMAAYIQWIAPQYASLQKTLPNEHLEMREGLSSRYSHRRTSDTLIKLLVSVRLFLRFATEKGAISSDETEALFLKTQKQLMTLSTEQAEIQNNENPVDQFFHFLRSGFLAGKIHLVDSETGQIPPTPNRYGWNYLPGEVLIEGDNTPRAQANCRGDKIGWVHPKKKEIYLNPTLAFGAICRIARDQNESIPLASSTLYKRLKERGLLAASDEGKNTSKRTVEGYKERVIVIAEEVFDSMCNPSSKE